MPTRGVLPYGCFKYASTVTNDEMLERLQKVIILDSLDDSKNRLKPEELNRNVPRNTGTPSVSVSNTLSLIP